MRRSPKCYRESVTQATGALTDEILHKDPVTPLKAESGPSAGLDRSVSGKRPGRAGHGSRAARPALARRRSDHTLRSTHFELSEPHRGDLVMGNGLVYQHGPPEPQRSLSSEYSIVGSGRAISEDGGYKKSEG